MSQVPAIANPTWSIALVRDVAMDIGKEVAAHIEAMYPAAVLETGPSMLLSVRNCVFNEIIAALDTTDEDAIRARLARRKALRRASTAASAKARKAT